jgi:hypothetical protein
LTFGSSQRGVTLILLLAAMGKEVSSTKKINGVTLQKAAESGLFSLAKASGTRVKVQMPFLTFAVLNSNPDFSICSKLVVNPFEKDYAEDLAIAALQIRIKWFQEQRNSTVTYNDLRPNADCTKQTKEIKFKLDITKDYKTVYTLGKRILTEDADKFNIHKIPLEANSSIDLSKGGTARGPRSKNCCSIAQPHYDSYGFFENGLISM